MRNRHFMILDFVLIPLAAYLSFVLRLDQTNISYYALTWLSLAGLATLIMPVVFYYCGIYTRYWRFASLDELLLLAGTVVGSTVGVTALTFLTTWLLDIPRPPGSIAVLFALLALTFTAAPRLAVRVVARGQGRRRKAERTGAGTRVLVMGASEAGALIVQEMRRNPQLGLDVAGFVDDDVAKMGMRIHGVPVLGNRYEIPDLAARYAVRQVIIALPSAPGRSIREVLKICQEAHLQTRIMPGLYELLGGKVSVNQLRKVEIEDLLRREQVQTDISAVKALLRGRRVLITGAGGSIGSELCRQVLQCQPARLIVLGHGENSVFEIENELKRRLAEGGNTGGNTDIKVSAVIADLRMPERLRVAFEAYRPQVVFHAAAHKHVPLMELNPSEAVTNNVIGTRNLLELCQRYGVERYVQISTDKAVNPTSVMGASKRVAELLVLQAARASGCPFVAVRFGNVLGSRGSVVLTFRQQIAAGGPVTVTHPDMRRFFMTIPEAVQLVLQASVLGRGGEIFTLDMGEPVRLVDLARDMIRLSGLEEGRDIDITFTGIRPGEKLFEELFIKGEEYWRTEHAKIFIARNASSFVPPGLNDLVHDLESAACHDDPPAMSAMFHQLIPEYQPAPRESGREGERARGRGGEGEREGQDARRPPPLLTKEGLGEVPTTHPASP